MSYDNADADDIFNRIQNSLMMAEADDIIDDDFIEDDVIPNQNERIEEDNGVIDANPSDNITLSKDSTAVENDNNDQTEKDQEPKKKVYQFTEVSDGKKVNKRRPSQFSQLHAIQQIPIQPPLLRGQDISEYKPVPNKLSNIIKCITKRNQKIVEQMNLNQKSIFKKFLTINMLSEEIMKKSDENIQLTTTQQATNKMREFEMLELRIMKYKPHLTYMTQR